MLLMPVGGALLLLLAAVEAFWRALAGLPPTRQASRWRAGLAMIISMLFLGLLLLLFTGLPIFAGLAIFGGALRYITQGELGSVTEVVFGEVNRDLLVAIPLFAFMAHIMIRGRIVDDLYGAAYTLTRHLPGGLGIATIAACTIFAAISGSSVATALTIGAVAC